MKKKPNSNVEPGKPAFSNERLRALKVLIQVFEKKLPFSQLLSSDQEYSSFTKALCYGVCRHYYRLESIAKILVKKMPKDEEVWMVIILGLYQIFYSNQKEYAIVRETVELPSLIGKTSAKGLINAVLRNALRQKETLLKSLQENTPGKYGHPAWLLELLKNSWPENWQEIVSANDEHPPMTLRVNTRIQSVLDYQTKLHAKGIQSVVHPLAIEGLILNEAVDVHELPEFSEGAVIVQDAAAQLAAHLLDLKPKMQVLDACCAPGGKTGHILQLQPDISCLAIDVDERRLLKVRDNLNRLKLHATVQQADILEPKTFWNGKLFDRILLDAPCSATGVIRRHPDIKITRTKESIDILVQTQAKMLECVWPMLDMHGLLVYATCSILPMENSEQIRRFTALHTDCQIMRLENDDIGQWTGYGWQILPGFQNMDGFFYSVLKKCEPHSNISQ